jgi:hypothetical protein
MAFCFEDYSRFSSHRFSQFGDILKIQYSTMCRTDVPNVFFPGRNQNSFVRPNCQKKQRKI